MTCQRCGVETCTFYDVQCKKIGTGEPVTCRWCIDCVRAHAFQCSDCLLNYSNSYSIYEYRSRPLCSSCVRSRYANCLTCGDIIELGNEYCAYCRTDRFIHEYDYKPTWNYHGDAADIKYGVELELSTRGENAETFTTLLNGQGESEVCFAKSDSSIVGGGFELVTHPCSLSFHRRVWKTALPVIIKDATADGNGMHIHVEREKLSTEDIGRIVSFVNMSQNYNFITDIAGRDSRRWSKLDSSKAMSASGRHCVEDDDRYVAVNLTNYETIEIRIFRGTVDYSRFMANMEFVDALIHWVKEITVRFPEDLDSNKFEEWVKQKENYPELKRFLEM